MRTTIKTTLVAAAVVGVVAGTSGVAFADDCFNASRSATGSTSAGAHSGNWWTLPEMLTTFIGLDANQTAAVMKVIDADPRIPANLTLFFLPSKSGKVFELGQNMPERLAVNGTGIDHSDDYPGLWEALEEDLGSVLGG